MDVGVLWQAAISAKKQVDFEKGRNLSSTYSQGLLDGLIHALHLVTGGNHAAIRAGLEVMV